MRIFVISLPTQVERRDLVRSQFEKTGLAFSFFNAISVSKVQCEYFRSFDAARFYLNTGRSPVVNEIGCYASHRTLWRTCISLDEPIIVLEDDICFDEQFEGAMPFIERNIKRLGFIRLEFTDKPLGQTVSTDGRYSANYCPRYPHSTKAYALSPKVAREFVDASHTFDAPVDKFIKKFWVHGQPLYQLTPHIISEANLGARATSIGIRRKPRQRSLSLRLKRMAYKAGCWIGRFRFNLVFGHRKPPRLKTTPQNSHKIPVVGKMGNQ